MHAQPCRDGVVLAVIHHRQTEFTRVEKRVLHEQPCRNRAAVVREADDPRPRKLLHVRQLDALAPPRDCTERQHPHGPGFLRAMCDEVDNRRRVYRRRRVRHRADRREPSGCGCGGARLDGLLVLETRLPQVCVQIDEPRCGDEPLPVNDERIRGSCLRRIRDESVPHEQVGRAVRPRSRIDDPRAGDEDRPAHSAASSCPPVSNW